MMTTIQKWFMITAMWVALVFMGGAFYWMQIRPAQVRKMCASKAKIVCENARVELSNMLEINRAIYADCLRANGVDK
jgi:hypothetical protein